LEKWDVKKSLQISMGGTGGYMISKKGAKSMLELIETCGMINCIDTMMQKSANTLSVYYCKPLLIYGECYTQDVMPDTDIQNDFGSLDLKTVVDKKEYPNRLMKGGKYNINEAMGL
jgi:GR25 family glycosyltransferase involved in LPS biosynthesis